MSEPLVTLIFPVYNQIELFKKALLSLERTTDRRFICHVVDDGSTEPIQKLILDLKKKGHITYPVPYHRIEHTGNSTVVVNEGAIQAETPYLAYMNSDLEFHDPEWLGATLECFDRFSDKPPSAGGRKGLGARKPVGAVGLKQIFPINGPFPGQVAHNGNVFNADGTWTHLEERVPQEKSQFCTSGYVEGVTGAGLFTPTDVWRSIGGFPVMPIFGWDDNAYCLELARRGYSIVCQREHPVLHVRSASYGRPKHPLYYENKKWIRLRYGAEIDRMIEARESS